MKKRDLLLAGLFLFSVSAFAQEPGVDEPMRYKDDAKVIFTQDFEGSSAWVDKDLNLKPAPTHEDWHIPLHTWNPIPVDSIEQMEYYVRPDDGGQIKVDIYGGDANYEIAGVRDTLMLLYDGVVKTDNSYAEDSMLQWDKFYIVEHDQASQAGETGKKGLDAYGENGGDQYFRYISATSKGVSNRGGGTSSGWSSSHNEASTTEDHYVPEYRRNLFVRNIPIEDSSSYRVTVFVRPTVNTKLQKGVQARIALELMRGYFHSEKNFQVNREGDSKVSFNDKQDYTDLSEGEWNKITLMAYYTNDSLGDASAYDQTYYWNTDWDWRVPVNAEGKVDYTSTDSATLRYVKQPDKFFVRMAFRSDSTTFDVDNLTLTKSWIGGVEYYNEMIRVDMGYETNLGDLAQQALEINKIASVELPGQYFDVWGRWEDDHHWERVPILSAEYQGDGYMYMWTEPDPITNEAFTLDVYDSLLVSFTNPTDPDLQLRYTGTRYPNGMDKEWIADAKKRIVFDFHNEIGYLNPTIYTSPVTHQPVKSLAELTPVLQKPTIEDGAFGLDPATTELTFKFSKNLSFDNGEMGISTKTLVRLIDSEGHSEFWDIVEYPEDAKGFTTIRRRAANTAPLGGDYVVNFMQVTHLKNPDLDNTNDYSSPINVSYHFGDFADDTRVGEYAKSDWRSEILETGAWDRPMPASLWCYDVEDGFYGGEGLNYSPYKKCGLYKMKDDGKNGDALFYLSGRKNNNYGSLYTVENLAAGKYQISFSSFGWARQNDIKVYLYAKPAGDMAYEKLSAATKTLIGTYKPSYDTSWSGNNTEESWNEKVERFSFDFSVSKDGDYVIEWETPKEGSQSYYGVAIGNYIINSAGPVALVNSAIDAADAMLLAADADKYRGADYNALTAVREAAGHFIADKKAALMNLPSEYNAEKIVIDEAVEVLKLHIDTVDAFYKALADAEAKLAVYADSLKAYELLAVVGDLQDVVADYFTYDCSVQAPGQIAADTKRLIAACDAVDARQALNDDFNKAVAAAKEVKADPNAVKYATLYDNLSGVLAAVESFDAIGAEDDELKEMTASVNDAKNALKIMLDGAEALVARIKALDKLATSVNANYGDASAEIATRIQNIDSDDESLAKIMKSAIKLAIYDNIVKGDTANALDVTGFIRNFNLYATPKIVERTSIKANSGDAKIADPDGANIQHVQHQWNSGDLNGQQPIWIMIEENEINNLYPGWTVYAYATGNCMVTPDDDTYGYLKQGVALFDGQLAMDWSGKADLKTTVDDLPLGKYNLSITLKQNSGSNTVLTASAKDDTLAVQNYTGSADAVKNIVVGDGNLDIKFTLTSGSGWSQADNFKLTYSADTLFNYTELLEEAKVEFDNIITVVDFAEVAGAEYEYYTLNWIKVEAPEKGKVYFRKSGNVVEKVIFK